MNPEFQRNAWLELTPLRRVVMGTVLALAFFAAALSGGVTNPGAVARFMFAAILVCVCTRNAARSVVGESRERTWDGQRLASLGPGTMMWGKLFGATIYNWFGGIICLVVIAADAINSQGAGFAFTDIVYWIAMGIIAQAASLLASLIAARRRQGRTPFEILLYQVVGLAAAYAVWAIANPDGETIGIFAKTADLVWWGQTLPTAGFLLASLAVFTGWILTGCYRQMRLELKLSNGPYVWLGFLIFMTVYAAGFGAFASPGGHFDEITRRLIMAALVAAALAYLTVILEPKSRVKLRWLASEFGKFHIGTALTHLPCWLMSYLFTALIAIALLLRLGLSGMGPELATTGAVLGFVTRDIAIVVLMNMVARRRGGDFLALAVLFLLYALLPSIVAGMHYDSGRALFLPLQTDPLWLSPVVAWLEAIVIWTVAATQISLAEKR